MEENKKLYEAPATDEKVSERKRLFDLKAMEEFVGRNQFLNDKYNKLEYYGKDMFGYHYNEVIMNIIFNKYVMGNKKLKKQYEAIAKDFIEESTTTAGHGGSGGGSGQYSSPVAFQRGKFMDNTYKEMKQTPTGSKMVKKPSLGFKTVNTKKLNMGSGSNYFISGLGGTMSENLLLNTDLLMEYLENQVNDNGITSPDAILLTEYPMSISEIEDENFIYFSIGDIDYSIEIPKLELMDKVRIYMEDMDDEAETIEASIKDIIFNNQTRMEDDSVNENTIKEHHIESRENKISFILSNSEKYTESSLNNLSDEDLNSVYDEIETAKFDDENGDENKEKSNILFDKVDEEEEICEECDKDMIAEADARHPQMIRLDRIHAETEKDSREQYSNLNKGIQDMQKGKEDSTFKYDYDKDSMKPNNVPKYRMSKENDEYVNLMRFGIEDVEYDVEPGEAYWKRIEKEMGKERFERMMKRKKFIKDKKLDTRYPKEAVPVDVVKEGFETMAYGAYTNSMNKRNVLTFDINNVKHVNSINEDVYKITTDGFENDSNIVRKAVNENHFYIDVNKNIYAVSKDRKENLINEFNDLDKMNKLINYNPNDWISRKKNLKG